MGLFDGRSYSYSEGQHHSHSHSHSHSPTRSVRSTHSKSGTTGNGYYVRPSTNAHRSSSSSFFVGGGGSSRGIFSSSSAGGSSYYKRSPREGYITYLLHRLRRMLRELWYYARRHPMKAFLTVVVPLLSAGGAIHGLMRQFGVRAPMGLDGSSRRSGGGYYGSAGYGGRSPLGGGAGGGGGGLMDNLGGVMQIAKAFM